MRTLSIIALIAITASPAVAGVPVTDTVQPAPYGARDDGDRKERATLFETSELSEGERNGTPRTRALDPGDHRDRATTFQISELSAAERRGQG